MTDAIVVAIIGGLTVVLAPSLSWWLTRRERSKGEAITESASDAATRAAMRDELRKDIQSLRERVDAATVKNTECEEERDEYRHTMLNYASELKLCRQHNTRLEEIIQRQEKVVFTLTSRLDRRQSVPKLVQEKPGHTPEGQ